MPQVSACLIAFAVGVQPPSPPRPIVTPVCKDQALEIALFAAEPDIVTPTGVAVAADGAILVVENHTHFPLKDYKGPKFDRILRFVDKNDDGKPDSRNVFADGLKDTMGIAAHPDGSVWVACRRAIYRYVDANNDGVADEKRELIRLDTKADYPHNGLSGFVIEPTKFGDVYFGLGENFGEPYTIVGPDGSKVSGGGEGGSVYRCRYDGGRVERFATGFWNPYHGCLDGYGRLFIVDNDPDDRPPCRLLHVVLGGDYGYRFRNGRRGIHPFTAWNGELPGTLPMVAGTGEAPSGLVHIASDAFGAHNRDAIIGTSWGDHRLERFRLVPRGASFHSQPEPIVTGNEDFRPVGVCTDKIGNLWATDWVDKSYNVHGKGRIWRVRAKQRPKTPVVEERPYQDVLDVARNPTTPHEREWTVQHDPQRFAAALRLSRDTAHMVQLGEDLRLPEPNAELLRRSAQSTKSGHYAGLQSADSFVAQAALYGVVRGSRSQQVREMLESPEAWTRLAGILVHRMQEPTKNADWLVPRFDDSDPQVQFAAIQTVGEHRIKSLRPHIVKLLESGKATGKLFLACTAALDDLDRVKTHHGDEFNAGEVLVKFVLKPTATPLLIREALPFISANHPELKIDRLEKWLTSDDSALRLAVVQTLRERPIGESQPRLLRLLDSETSLDLKLEAVLGLNPAYEPSRLKLIELAAGMEPALRRESLRSLRTASLNNAEISRLRAANQGEALVDHLLGKKPVRPKPTDTKAWLERMNGPADAEAGRRVFFHQNGPGCFKCHRVGERGGQAGPDLSAAGGAMTRERIVESILQPHKEVAPMFTPWTLLMADGTTRVGLFVGGTNQNTQAYVDPNGQRFEVRPEDVESRKPATTSIMPAELVDAMTDQEFRDLLAYLEAVKRKGR
jgi:putative membrane-bound dehydrogenase-like protein